MASQTITALGNAIINLVDRKTPIATANTVGMVKPDGSTINIDANGVISSNGGGGSGLELCDIGMALYVDETKGLRRYLNGQIVDINTNTQKFLNRLKQITTLYPSLLCTEKEWQSAKTLSAFGQVGKFVFNYSGDKIVSVRLPRVVNVQGLFDLQNLGMTVSAGLPNITGSAGYTVRLTSASGAFDYGSGGSANQWGAGDWGEVKPFTFNASRSNSIYGNSDTVQPEAIQYPYFIQIATGSETENNIINEIELNNPYSLFDCKYSDHELNNLSWLKSEGQWNAKAVYTDAYDELLTEYNNSASVNKTEGSITFKRTPKGYKIALADQETAILNKYNSEGIAWYYILDTANKRFKLPRTKFGFEGLRTSVGDDIKPKLPNITGSFNNIPSASRGGDSTTTGCVTRSSKSTADVSYYGADYRPSQLTFSIDASRSSSIYGNSNTVQPPATQMYLYFYVGETVQNANLIDAGRIGEQLANKQDKCIHIISTYVNGKSGYRIWSDGYCEQWGESTFNSGGSTVSLLKTMKSTEYIVTNMFVSTKTDDYGEGINVNVRTVSSFTAHGYHSTALTNVLCKWLVKGYLASGQY